MFCAPKRYILKLISLIFYLPKRKFVKPSEFGHTKRTRVKGIIILLQKLVEPLHLWSIALLLENQKEVAEIRSEKKRKEMNLNMDSVESLVAQIQGLSGNLSDINHLHNLLKQSEELLHSESTRLISSLSQLDPSIHSLGYLYFL